MKENLLNKRKSSKNLQNQDKSRKQMKINQFFKVSIPQITNTIQQQPIKKQKDQKQVDIIDHPDFDMIEQKEMIIDVEIMNKYIENIWNNLIKNSKIDEKSDIKKGKLIINDPLLNLHVQTQRHFLTSNESLTLQKEILDNIQWYRVAYKSRQYKKQCVTPCWTNFFGGVPDIDAPYQPIPDYLKKIQNKVSQYLGGVKFNAILVRLYFDGNDNIAWHTDGRSFLGNTPTIASLSLGGSSLFEMRRMHNVWPEPGDNGIDKSQPIKQWVLEDGDLLIMRRDTQKHWHHRVPQEKNRQPRININFRYIIPMHKDTLRGQQTFYKYMISGDQIDPKYFTFDQISNQENLKIQNYLATTHVIAQNGVRQNWKCDQCTYINSSVRMKCEICLCPLNIIDPNNNIKDQSTTNIKNDFESQMEIESENYFKQRSNLY